MYTYKNVLIVPVFAYFFISFCWRRLRCKEDSYEVFLLLVIINTFLRLLMIKVDSHGLYFPATSDFKLKGFCDSDWGSCFDTRRFATGFCLVLGLSLVSWQSKKQYIVSRSSSEANYRALVQATCEAQWFLYLLQDLQLTNVQPVVFFCDNQSALHIGSIQCFMSVVNISRQIVTQCVISFRVEPFICCPSPILILAPIYSVQ